MRACDPRSLCLTDGKYGAAFHSFADIPGGVRYGCAIHLDPPLEFEAASSMEISYRGSTELHEKYRLVDVEVEPYENEAGVPEDPAFSKMFLGPSGVAIVRAIKAKKFIRLTRLEVRILKAT
ncbi:hypothetical protein PG993_000818 [Apiospora rasikravindrae]|uniref:Uncharacterized protein n=1 Tax=Apiospora rasikravindrae TaxID=990691 RepID=A0ABR1U9N7_9PEZI